jgi:hypothetical protein
MTAAVIETHARVAEPAAAHGGHDATFLGPVTDTVCGILERPRPPRAWYIAFAVSLTFTGIMGAMIVYLVSTGIGVWGLNQPVGWAWDITNFVFWVGIGHAGTLISAILFLFRQDWRTSINRFAEAMTLFAVACAGVFPAIHVGRAWAVYWLTPYPNTMQMWPNFRSPLLWDVFAVSTYATVSLLFWYMGLIPDLATVRDRATTKLRQFVYGLVSLGWRGSARNWARFEKAYLLLAALATPLVLSVHSVVSFDFAVSLIPGWHTTIFPPYFVAGAVFSGFAMVVTLMVPARAYFGLKDLVTMPSRKHEQGHPRHRHDGRLCLRHRVLHGLVQRQSLRTLRLHQPRHGPLCLGLLDHGVMQRPGSPGLLVQEGPHHALDDDARRPADQRRHVVRALRDHRHVAQPRLPAVELGLLRADRGGRADVRRELWAVFYVVSAVLPVRAHGGAGGSQGGHGRRARVSSWRGIGSEYDGIPQCGDGAGTRAAGGRRRA